MSSNILHTQGEKYSRPARVPGEERNAAVGGGKKSFSFSLRSRPASIYLVASAAVSNPKINKRKGC